MTVVNDADFQKTLTVKDLVVRGRVNTDNASWNELSDKISRETVQSVKTELTDKITDSVLKTVKKKGVDITDVKVNGDKLITDGALSNTITNSNLEKVGTLQELSVIGATSLNETVTVSRGKLGINTESPNMALDVWDGEVQITLGKKKQDTGYIGLGRKGTLEIGSSNTAITIDSEGKTKINELMIGRNNISWGNEVPGYSGQKGDIVFNMNPTSSNCIGWQCLGKFKWRPFN